VHIAFLELIIDPVCSVVFEAETKEKNISLAGGRAQGIYHLQGSRNGIDC